MTAPEKHPDEIRSKHELCAAIAWGEMNKDQRNLVRFGMIPKEIVDEFGTEPLRKFSVALMGEAERDGGMVS